MKGLASALLLALAGGGAHAAERDPLMLYDGEWRVSAASGPTDRVRDRCAEGPVAITCEQVLNGKPVAVLVFQFQGASDGGRDYISTALPADGGPPRRSRLHLAGEVWTYGSDRLEKGAKVYDRVVNTFSGPDRIHYDIQVSSDGVHWTTTSSGDEQRVGT